jgi:hypothetical protein
LDPEELEGLGFAMDRQCKEREIWAVRSPPIQAERLH